MPLASLGWVVSLLLGGYVYSTAKDVSFYGEDKGM